ncbi:hypothetical protein M2272_005643 [Mycobacterium frederiksbergense]|uniref:Uncharacterized protein n=1 Tax=Mycolicibacterium frederiksbergense TaxID=117567 RepID=A0ABT6L7U9_9MYCO|nr:hypothetical protein [Mycolicibacterium frederiksbergense]MDH6198979.1 hypothetical protein [Mycolicibacterium frederiksbergense]
MSKVTTASAKQETRQPVLITEHEVLFNTAAALRSPARRGVIARMSGAVTSVVGQWRTHADHRTANRHYPARLIYLERSLMLREIDRL